MRMIVDHSGNDGSSPEVDPPGAGSSELRNLCTAANRHKAIAPDGHGLGNRKALVDGDDFSVRENEIRSGLLRAD